jgi:hypothetical protein
VPDAGLRGAEVLQPDRHPRQRAGVVAALDGRRHVAGGLAGPLAEHRDVGVDVVAALVDPVEVGVDDVDRREVAPPDARREFGRRGERDVVAHRTTPECEHEHKGVCIPVRTPSRPSRGG